MVLRTVVMKVEKMCKCEDIYGYRDFTAGWMCVYGGRNWLSLFPPSTVITFHHGKKEDAKAGPGLVAELLGPLLVFTRAWCYSCEVGLRRGRLCCHRSHSFPSATSESEVSISDGSPAHACLDGRPAVPTQTLLLLQGPGHLLPVQSDVRGELRAGRRASFVLATEAAATLLAVDSQDDDLLAPRRPVALTAVFGDRLPLQALRWFCLAGRLHGWLVPVLAPVRPSSPPPLALLAADQRQLMGDATQQQQDSEVGEERHEHQQGSSCRRRNSDGRRSLLFTY